VRTDGLLVRVYCDHSRALLGTVRETDDGLELDAILGEGPPPGDENRVGTGDGGPRREQPNRNR
jgi:hypothetical protein